MSLEIQLATASHADIDAALKARLRIELPRADWYSWLRHAVLVRVLSGSFCLLALPPSGSILAAAMARESGLRRLLECDANYFCDVEVYFRRRRRFGGFLSCCDWELLRVWRDAGIPRSAIARGVDEVFERADRRDQWINSLGYCAQAVLQATRDMREAAVGAERLAGDAQPFADPLGVGFTVYPDSYTRGRLLEERGIDLPAVPDWPPRRRRQTSQLRSTRARSTMRGTEAL